MTTTKQSLRLRLRQLAGARSCEPVSKFLNQKGVSSLILLFVLVLTVFIIWEMSEYIGNYNSPAKFVDLANCPSGIPTDCFDTDEGAGAAPICETGEEGNCNDSNDVFLLAP